jgi:hypothetical protein
LDRTVEGFAKSQREGADAGSILSIAANDLKRFSQILCGAIADG